MNLSTTITSSQVLLPLLHQLHHVSVSTLVFGHRHDPFILSHSLHFLPFPLFIIVLQNLQIVELCALKPILPSTSSLNPAAVFSFTSNSAISPPKPSSKGSRGVLLRTSSSRATTKSSTACLRPQAAGIRSPLCSYRCKCIPLYSQHPLPI